MKKLLKALKARILHDSLEQAKQARAKIIKKNEKYAWDSLLFMSF